MRRLNQSSTRSASTIALAALLFGVLGCNRGPGEAEVLSSAAEEVPGICDSTLHESSPVDGDYAFDLACGLTYIQAAGCDFGLDANGDGSVIASSIIEDMFNDPIHCIRGNACSGCGDQDTIDTVQTCSEFAGFSYFTSRAWSDLQAACPVVGDDPGGGAEEDPQPTGCTIEGLEFPADERACATQFFTTMTCDSCREVIDSRVCEDAINDPALCQVGNTCTGCDDGDTRGNGVDCEEIEEYSYFGPAASQALYEHVQANPCEDGCAPSCEGKVCGDDGCGGSCGTCQEGQTCDQDGQCAGGCTIEGVVFAEDDLDCATEFFTTMDCERCREVFDSRICEDAINDADACQSGGICTGCTDSDTRDDGVTCDEIAAYSYFGASAAGDLLEFVQSDLTCGDPGVVVDGVPFTEDEAAAVLEVANGASQEQLDDEAGLNAVAAGNIVSSRPISTVEELGAIPYVGASALQALLTYAMTWVPPGQGPQTVTLTTLADEADQNGEASVYYGQLVQVARAIVTSEPYATYGGATLFYAADPAAGSVEQIKVYVSADAQIDVAFATIHDDVQLTGTFTSYNGTFQILIEDPAAHTCALNRSGLAFEDYLTVLAAWSSTQDNPEGAVYVTSSFGYSYMVPLPLFLTHPMWNGSPPGAPGDDGNEQDHAWNSAAQDALEAWLAAQ